MTRALDRSTARSDRFRAKALACLVVAGLAFRAFGLNRYCLWLDEAVQYTYALGPFERLFIDAPPEWMFLPLYLTKLQIVLGWDHSDWQLRFPSLIFGVLTVPAIFLLAREMFNQRVALVAGALAVIWPRLIEYSQEMRPYALFAFLAAVSGFSILRAIRTGEPEYWALFAVGTLLGLYNHVLATFGFLSLGLFTSLILAIQGGRLFRQAPSLTEGVSAAARLLSAPTIAFSVIGVGLLPTLGFYWNLANLNSRNEPQAKLALTRGAATTIFGSYLGLGPGFASVVIWLMGLVGFGYACARFRKGALLAATWLLVPALYAVKTGGARLFTFSPRYLLFLVPVLLPLFAAGIVLTADTFSVLAYRLWSRSPLAALKQQTLIFSTAAVVAMGFPALSRLYSTNPKQVPVDVRSAYSYLLKRATPQDVILGFGQPQVWQSGWFNYTSSYFLRPAVSRPGMSIIPIGSDPNRGEIPFDRIDASHGKLYAVIGLGPGEMTNLRRAAEGAFTTVCWDHICVLESLSDIPMHARADDLFTRFAFIDPAGLTPLPELHRKAATIPSPTPPPQTTR